MLSFSECKVEVSYSSSYTLNAFWCIKEEQFDLLFTHKETSLKFFQSYDLIDNYFGFLIQIPIIAYTDGN